MNRKLSYVYEHRNEYKAILESLKEKSQTLPGLDLAIYYVEKMLSHCDWYEQWRIDSKDFDYPRFGYYDEVYACFVKEIHNQPPPSQTIYPNEDMLVICHSTGAYIFGEDHPRDFFDKFYEEVKAVCPPDHEDNLNSKIYYKRERAKEAYESYCKIREKYEALNVERRKQSRIKELEEELARAKGEN